MARRLISQVARMRGGSTIGAGVRIRFFDDEALTSLSAIYRRSSGGGTQPNPIMPNAGRVTALTVNGAAIDTTITVADTAGFQVGDLIPIRSGATFVYRVITNINVGTGVITLDLALGAIFTAATTVVGAPEMRGHLWGWLETVVDPFAEIEDIASGRRSPPLQIPLSIPTSAIAVQGNGALVGSRTVLNFIGPSTLLTVQEDVPNARINITINDAHLKARIWVAGVF